MSVSFQRQTLSSSATFDGFGLHSGTPVTVRIEPSDKGIWFQCGSERVQARPEFVTDTSRCTRLGTISTVGHVMSALGGFGVTDADVVLTAPELPALDGASLAFSEGISNSGLEPLGEMRFGLFERVFFVEDPIRIAVAKGEGHWR